MSHIMLGARVLGIPCIVEVLSYSRGEKPDWRLLDRRGRPAPWLERKLSRANREEVTEFVYKKMEDV